MKTARERLEFAVRFVALNLDDLSPGGWLSLREDLGAFLCRGPRSDAITSAATGGILPGLGQPDPATMRPRAYRNLQGAFRYLLEKLADGQHGSIRFTGLTFTVLSASSRKGRGLLIVNGATADQALYLLMNLIARDDTSPILRCPECRTLFYRVDGRQKYCKRPCVNRASQRAYRTRA
jgi:hypothetical protein